MYYMSCIYLHLCLVCAPLLLQSIMAADFNQLDFDMTQQQREKLLIRGMEAGRRFLEK